MQLLIKLGLSFGIKILRFMRNVITVIILFKFGSRHTADTTNFWSDVL